MELTQVGEFSHCAIPEQDSFEAPTASPLSPSVFDLGELIGEEHGGASPDTDVTDFLVTEERIVQEVELLQAKNLSQVLAAWVADYAQVGSRERYLWTWCQQGVQVTTLPGVAPDTYDELCDTKVLGVMLDVLLDDVADQKGDVELLGQMLRIPFSDQPLDWQRFTHEECDYAAFAEVVWNEVQLRVERFPRYDVFQDVLRYDYGQLLNTMRYAHLLNRFPSMLNLAEHDLYLPHNMHMMISATMDLMCSPGFDFDELGRLREAIWHAQYMGRIGNLVTTWERELLEGDFTSGVFAHAVIHGDLTLEQLENGDRDVIARAIRQGQHEEYFLRQWQGHRRRLIDLQVSLRSVDLKPFVHGIERLFCLHMASRGLK